MSKTDSKDSLGDRLKKFEDVPRISLMAKTPVIIRLDGKSFHSFCKKFPRPYSQEFNQAMWQTAIYLCEEISGVKLAYVQSDEISLFLSDLDREETQPWFGYGLQKVVSVSASTATAFFAFQCHDRGLKDFRHDKFPAFDSRAFNLPLEEVLPYFCWRQADATRNSVSSLAQSLYSHKELHLKNQAEMHEMLYEKGIYWGNCPVPQKRGVCVVKENYQMKNEWQGKGESTEFVTRSRWVVDENIPIFTQDRNYIMSRIISPSLQESTIS